MKSPKATKIPTYAEILHEILSPLTSPIATEELAEKLLQKRPSKARNPRQAALIKIREETGRQLVYLDPDHVVPLHLAYQGARYRIRLTRENVDQTALSGFESFENYLPPSFKLENITFIDSRGTPIPFQIVKPPHTVTFTSEKNVEYQEPVFILKAWFRSQKIFHKHHILVTIADWDQGVLRLECEKLNEQGARLLAERNQHFADSFYEMLETTKYEDIDLRVALPTTYARIPDKNGCPPDHYRVIIDQDPRMITNRWSIHYADGGFTMQDRPFMEATGQSLIAPAESYTKEEGQQVYRLRAQLTQNPSLWREVELQGKQTLENLDGILRDTFEHDIFDHLSGFWKRIARSGGVRKRYREVDLGTINPFEYGEGSDTAITALKLQVGDQLKYVYDFGDWIEHKLVLQSISSPEKGVHYPREVARNKPKYEYCVECQKNGQQTVAIWICYTCSNDEQRDILLCDHCLREHEDHYVKKLLY
ncbi:MAG: plasmid pRiA4b ORF-3 family protein [Anaerolineaceae bacterium]|nr:plasmid pRiA4b ORF-3 family protein [Anaerolineaceae bacterium]